MAQTKIYPATQAQAQDIQDTVDEINAKIVTPNYQVKAVNPSNVQQTVQADSGYTALSGVVVNPIAALMPQTIEDYIMRNERTEPFSINVNGSIPDYACYGQIHLAAVYGELNGVVGAFAFNNCSSLQTIDARNVTSINDFAFNNCSSLQTIDARNVTSINGRVFQGCSSLQNIDLRNITSISSFAFGNCSSLQNIDARNVTSISSFAFYNCSNLQNIDCTSCTTPPTIQLNTFDATNRIFHVIVATDTEKALFQSATNWSIRADQIYTVAEIEALYGDTYDNLYLQWFGHPRFDESEGE